MRGSWRNDPDLPTSTSAGRKKPTRPLHQFHSLSTLAPLALSHKASSASLSGNADHESDAGSDAEDPKELLIQSMKRLSLLDRGPSDKANRIYDAAFRFHGKSTTYTLVSETREMKTRYFLESMGLDVDTITHELERVRVNPNVNAQAMEGGLRRAEYWRSPNVSIPSCAAMTPPHLVVTLSLGTVLSNYPYLMLYVSSGNSTMKGKPLRKPSRDFFNTGHSRIWQQHL